MFNFCVIFIQLNFRIQKTFNFCTIKIMWLLYNLKIDLNLGYGKQFLGNPTDLLYYFPSYLYGYIWPLLGSNRPLLTITNRFS
jgi:hypothetical protein